MPDFNSMDDVKKHLNALPSLSQLKPEDYALKGGIADFIASTVGKDKEMKFTQIRKFFGNIKKIETVKLKDKRDEDKIDSTDFYQLMPELAYGYGRGLITREFYDVMKICLTGGKIQRVKDFTRFIELLSAVIAYNKEREADKKKGGRE